MSSIKKYKSLWIARRQDLLKEPWSLFSDRTLGPILAISSAMVLQGLVLSPYHNYIPSPISLFTVVVIYSVFRGGFRSGLVSSIISIFYLAYFFKLGHRFENDPADAWNRIISWSIALPVTVAIVNALKKSSIDSQAHQVREQELQEITEAIPQIVWTAKADGTIDYYNQKWFDYTGQNWEQAKNQGWRPILHPDDTQNYFDMWDNAVHIGEGYESEYRFKSAADGQYRWHLVRALPIKDKTDKITKWFGTCTDIDDQKRLNDLLESKVETRTQELSKQKKFLETILNTVSERIIVLDGNGDILIANPGMQNNSRLKIETVPFADRAAAFGLFKADKVTPLPSSDMPSARALRGEVVENLELYIRNQAYPNGGYVMTSASPIRDENNEIIGAVSVSRDITDLKKTADDLRASRDHMESEVQKRTEELRDAYETLEESKKQIDTVISNTDAIIFSINKEGTITLSQGKGMEKIGTTTDQRIGKSVFDLLKDNPERLKAIRRALAGEKVTAKTLLNGLWYHIHYDPILDANGTPNGVTGVAFNINEQVLSQTELSKTQEKLKTDRQQHEVEKTELEVRARAAIEASRLKSEFLANMSHEIRTPLNGVIGMMGLLADSQLAPEQRDYTESAKSSASALLTVINDILDFSKVEAGKLEFEDIDFDLPHMFKGAMSAFVFQARQKNIKLSLDIDPQIPKFVGGDPGRLRQVLNNLISNALKFTAQGEVSIKVRSQGAAGSLNRIRVEIKDTGIGIPEEALSRMFQAFSQADASTTRRFGGTGLGLSICKHLVENMQGKIGVESVDGNGSTFWFTIGLRSGNAPLRKDFEAAGNFSILTSRKFRVLVAEDNPVNQKIALKVLEKMGLSVDAVANGQEVLDAIRAIPYDLILMDCQMPEMDGYQATRLIRESKTLPRTNLPIIAMTANAISGDKEKCLEVGMNDYISKPVKSSELFSVLRRWLMPENSKTG